MSIPDSHLAAATNGAVFTDPHGEFTRIRKDLLAFYPADVLRKKLAARCARAAQAGQYNLPRCVAREEYVAAALAEAAFVEAAGTVVFLLNRRYAPFYKWMHRALKDLPLLGIDLFERFAALAGTQEAHDRTFGKKRAIVEDISRLIITELQRQGFSTAGGEYLLEHALSVQDGIEDNTLRNMNLFVGA
jgi:hypothetical protein